MTNNTDWSIDKLLMPRESGRFIAERSKSVSIVDENIKNLTSDLIKNLEEGRLGIQNFSQCDYHPNSKDPRAVDWIFVIDTLNFSFWSDVDDKRWKVNGESGYYALCAAIKRAIEKGIPLTNAEFLAKISRNELQDILRGDDSEGVTEIPLLDERVKNLNQVGRILVDKYKGTFVECIKACDRSADKLLKLIVREFECYRDEAFYDKQWVSFYKRAQILVGDLWACFQGKDLGKFDDINCITMFADYRVPQVLVYYGILKYSDELLQKLSTDGKLPVGSDEEIEIRGCSIEAVDRVVQAIKSNPPENSKCDYNYFNSITVDHYLWDYRRQHAEELECIPYHKTRTIYY